MFELLLRQFACEEHQLIVDAGQMQRDEANCSLVFSLACVIAIVISKFLQRP